MNLGGLDFTRCTTIALDSLPEDARAAYDAITRDLVGAKWTPVAYLGTQVVNGTGHCFIVRVDDDEPSLILVEGLFRYGVLASVLVNNLIK